jgi:hypothetical protein
MIKLNFFIFLILFSSSIFAAKAKIKSTLPSLKLSNSAIVLWPKELNLTSNFLPSFSAFSLTGRQQNKKISAWISRKTPDILANQASVERLWKENLENSKKVGEVQSTNFGCKEIGKLIFQCRREAEVKAGEFVSDSLYWNAKNDIVFFRTTSFISLENSKEMSEVFKVKLGEVK